ncbi:MAG: MFS transporter [Rhodospirillales bacterium]|nr:MFS transporter [Rhodospirillales bacterium]
MVIREPESRFRRLSVAGIFFQGGAAAVDSNTIIAALVYGLTANTYAVGAASAILRYGWLFPQIFVAYLAQRRQRRMPFYMIGAFGRAACLVAISGILSLAGWLPHGVLVALFFILWMAYAFVSGIVAVPYNDIVARSVASERRSRLLAIRFFGGGLLALGVAASADRLLNSLAFPDGYAAIVLLGAGLLIVSSLSFISAGEPVAPPPRAADNGFTDFLRDGIEVLRTDKRFRLFVHAQWLGGAVTMALPFYVLQVIATEGTASRVAFLLAAQTTGALLSNALWGWWGDRYGKRSLYEGVALLGAMPPLLIIALSSLGGNWPVPAISGFVVVFFLLGAVGNGITIAMLGYLMEISPNDRRPAYSGYFNALVAPAALLPLAGAVIVEAMSFTGVFAVSLGAAFLQFLIIRRLRDMPAEHVK